MLYCFCRKTIALFAFFLIASASVNGARFTSVSSDQCKEFLTTSKTAGRFKRLWVPSAHRLLTKDPAIDDFVRAGFEDPMERATRSRAFWQTTKRKWPRFHEGAALTSEQLQYISNYIKEDSLVIVTTKLGQKIYAELVQMKPTIIKVPQSQFVYYVRLNWDEVRQFEYEPEEIPPPIDLWKVSPWATVVRETGFVPENLSESPSSETGPNASPYRGQHINVPGIVDIPLGSIATFLLSNRLLVPGRLVQHSPPALVVNAKEGRSYFLQFSPNSVSRVAAGIRLNETLISLRVPGRLAVIDRKPRVIRVVEISPKGSLIYRQQNLGLNEGDFEEMSPATVEKSFLIPWSHNPPYYKEYNEVLRDPRLAFQKNYAIGDIVKPGFQQVSDSVSYEEIIEETGPRFRVVAHITRYIDRPAGKSLYFSDVEADAKEMLRLFHVVKRTVLKSPSHLSRPVVTIFLEMTAKKSEKGPEKYLFIVTFSDRSADTLAEELYFELRKKGPLAREENLRGSKIITPP